LRPSAEQISSVQGRAEMVSDRGELIPAVKLCELFGVETGCRQLTEGLLVIVEEDGHKCCLLVDELAEQQQVVIKNLGAALARVKGVSGGAIMGDGKVSLILDIPGLVQLSRQ